MSYAYLIQGSNITVVINNKPHTISKSHPTYEKVKEAIKANANYSDAHYQLAMAYLNENKMAEAVKSLEQFIALDPAHPAADAIVLADEIGDEGIGRIFVKHLGRGDLLDARFAPAALDIVLARVAIAPVYLYRKVITLQAPL